MIARKRDGDVARTIVTAELERSSSPNMEIWHCYGLRTGLQQHSPYASIGRRIAATQTGYFLLVPPDTTKGDVVYILEGGGSIGYVLRMTNHGPEHKFLGAAYVHGFYGVQNCWQGMEQETVVLK
jgi:hypothetical protein